MSALFFDPNIFLAIGVLAFPAAFGFASLANRFSHNGTWNIIYPTVEGKQDDLMDQYEVEAVQP